MTAMLCSLAGRSIDGSPAYSCGESLRGSGFASIPSEKCAIAARAAPVLAPVKGVCFASPYSVLGVADARQISRDRREIETRRDGLRCASLAGAGAPLKGWPNGDAHAGENCFDAETVRAPGHTEEAKKFCF